MDDVWAWEAVAWGAAGGGFVEVLRWFRARSTDFSNVRPWSWVAYALITLFMVAAGGVLVAAYMASDADLRPIEMVNLGASAPLVFSSIAAGGSDASPSVSYN